MACNVLDLELAASATALSGVYGITRAAQKLGIGRQSVVRYRKYFADHPEERARVEEKRRVLEREWAENLSGAIASGIDFLQRASEKADPKDPAAIHAVAGAVKILTEVTLNKRILDARLLRQGGSAGTPAGSGTPAAEGPEQQLGLQ